MTTGAPTTRPLNVYALVGLAVALLVVGVFFIAQTSALTTAASGTGAAALSAATQASRSWTAGWALVQSGLISLVAALVVWRR